MTILQPAPVLGVQRPRVMHLPPGISSSLGQEFIDLAESAGLLLDDWQQFHVRVATAIRADGWWAASEFGDVDPRQNGKGGIIEALKLGFLYLLKTPLVLYSAHYFPTSLESFRRMQRLIEGCDDLRRKTMKPQVSNGKEGFELTRSAGGGRLRYLARSKNSGRGFSAPVLFFDEAFSLDAGSMASLIPTMSAQVNPWVGYFSSAALSTSAQLHALRRRAISGDGGRLAYVEHSVDPEDFGGKGSAGWEEARRDPKVWAVANPALGIRISLEAVETELRTMPAGEFDRERLGVPDEELGHVAPVIAADVWAACLDARSTIVGPLVLAVDMPPERSHVTLVVGGRRADGLTHVEVVARRAGTKWLAGEVARLLGEHEIRHVLVAPAGPAGGLLPDLERACEQARPGVADVLRQVSSSEFTQACGRLFDLTVAEEPGVRHIGQDVLDVAVVAGQKKAAGDAWRWARLSTQVDISPLCAASLAAWAVDALPAAETPEAFVLFG